MDHITKDNQIITEGVKIYYEGDQANHAGIFMVSKIEPCKWSGKRIFLKETHHEEGEEPRIIIVSPSAFEPGVGTRLITFNKRQENRKIMYENMLARCSS